MKGSVLNIASIFDIIHASKNVWRDSFMATERKKQTKRHFDKRFFVFLFLAIIYICFLYYKETHPEEPDYDIPIIVEESSTIEESGNEDIPVVGLMHVHMIDCGQGDSFLIECNGKYALIDCGTRSAGDDVVAYLNKEHVDELQFIIGTHQHDDHMGGMYEVLSNFKCSTVYMPKVRTDLVTANWYLQLMSKIKKDKIKVVNPKIDDTFYLEDAKFTVIGQLSETQAGNNVNDYSTVIHLAYGDMDFVFTGDAETKVERQILNLQTVPDCEVLKVGHHGSDTSTSQEFLDAIDPEYCLISCGVGNKYEHPCTVTMDKLKKAKVKVYRTDECGDVVLTVTYEDITFSTKPGNYKDGVTVASERKE